ncbi:RlpA-like double-psi beta-barrel domain-containing protein [Oligoflexus tunisiensis]|uniref:RlpA-like double-psi beta-barrel domain-containing protein n=1 Tax=Oligoflexus tunisiensis TaxID=708132 RepID=UPI00114CFE56|nr:RlpA-like double-psi beta-barrel domain-containing protein [Oligoflexus tunisiensis]
MQTSVRRWISGMGLGVLIGSCQTTQDWGGNPGSRVYLSGRGIAKYHIYDGVSKCKTAFGLDPKAFGMRVTAASSQITKKFPGMEKAGRRNGPYETTARCIRVQRQGTDKVIVVRAIDICCGGDLKNPRTHQLDLSRQAFEQLGPPTLGNLAVSWAVVDCPSSLQVPNDAAVCDDNYYFKR